MSADVLTARGAATRARIVEAAADLAHERGVRATTFDDIRARTGASRSQLFHYFPGGKADLVRAVAARQAERVVDAQRPVLEHLDSWAGLRRWRDAVVQAQHERGCTGGCPLGSLASELAEHDEVARGVLADGFTRWHGLLRDGLASLRERGDLRPEADPDELALAVLTAVQGGLLLAQATRSTRPLEVALDAALQRVVAQARPRRRPAWA